MQENLLSDGGRSTALQRRLTRQIADWLRGENLPAGEAINQLELAGRFGVSRTPVKAALLSLSRIGVVRFSGRGAWVADPAIAPPPAEAPSPLDALINRLAADRLKGTLPPDVTEADLMRRYDVPRTAVVGALRSLAGLGVVTRKPGFGWRFSPAGTGEERQASYRFRLAVEPAALLEPGYAADGDWLAAMRDSHERFLGRTWSDTHAVAFFEMNARFHLGLVGFSRNRFFIQATEQQNGLRRLRNYSWTLGEDRVRVSCEDHLAILDAVGEGDMPAAAALMRRHLTETATLVWGTATACAP